MLRPKNIANIYNPQNQSYEELLKGFVIRKKEFRKIRKELEVSNIDSSIQHYLIEGQRGTGKTTLLLRIRYEIENSEDLSHLIAVQFGEEQYGIYDLCRIWENVAEILEDAEGFESLIHELDKANEDKNYSIDCFSILEKYLKNNNKRLVLLLDNFGDILDKLSDIEQKRLRDALHTSKYIQLITATSRSLEYTYRHDKPFFEFFRTIKLEGLDKEHTQILLEQLSSNLKNGIKDIIEKQPNRIEIIRRLTGGIPRTIVLLFEIFLDDSANVFEDLEAILDRVTPLYKHRMDDLPTQQQAIMDTIALNWDAISTKEITERLKKRGFNTKQVSSQLKVLERQDLIESRFMDKKNKIYLIKERFFNIWYLMRYGRKKSKQRVLWLIRFLEEWCDETELKERAKKHIQCAIDGKLNLKGHYMGEALASVISDPKIQYEILSETKKALQKHDSSIVKKISKSDKEIAKEADKAYSDKNFGLAIKNCKILIEKGHVGYMNNLGSLYHSELKDYDEAIKYYKMAIEKGSPVSMNNLGSLYHTELKDNDEAIKYYKMAIEKEDVNAINNLGGLYHNELKDYDEAIKYYKMAIEKEDVNAMNNLGGLYHDELEDNDEAIKYYKMAIEKEDVNAMNNLAWLYYEKNIRKKESLDLSQKSVQMQKSYQLLHTLAMVLLWNDEYKQSVTTIEEALDSDEYTSYMDDMIEYFVFLLAKKQYHLAYNLFTEIPELKMIFKPIYYTLMKLLEDEYPKEYIKMGEELEETVEEILSKVDQQALKYY